MWLGERGKYYALQFDLTPTTTDFAASHLFGISNPNLYSGGTAGKPKLFARYASDVGGVHFWLTGFDDAGAAGSTSEGFYANNITYRNKITYQKDEAMIWVTRVDTGEVIKDEAIPGLGRFTGMDRLYLSVEGIGGGSEGAIAEGYIDNVSFWDLGDPSYKQIYSEYFSKDPGWVTNNSSKFYWDSEGKRYHYRLVGGSSDYTYVTLPINYITGHTFVEAAIAFPSLGHRVDSWGTVSREGNTFRADATIYRWTGPSALAFQKLWTMYDLGSLSPGSYTFELYANGSFAKSLSFSVESSSKEKASKDRKSKSPPRLGKPRKPTFR